MPFTPIHITDNERKALQAIVDSEYQDGGGQHTVDHPVWTQYVNPFPAKKTQGGVYASLAKKKLISIADYDGMGTVAITQAGFDALQQEKA